MDEYRDIVMYGFSKARIMTPIKEFVICNIFKCSGTYYCQIRGLVMGQRLAPILPICYMSNIEEPVLSRKLLLYCRHIDDLHCNFHTVRN